MKSLTKNADPLIENYGGRIMLMQQKQSHSKKLSSIYQKKFSNCPSYSSFKKQKLKANKKQEYQNRQHLKNIKHLYEFISRKKSMQDRFKDPDDFFAYPVYFFRETDNNLQKNNKRKPLRRKKNHKNEKTQSQQSQFTRIYGIDVPTVKKYLPVLEQFTQKQLQELAGAITKIIITFELNSIQRIQFLKDCVLKTAKPHYPQLFSQIVEEIFQQVIQSIDLNFN